MADRSAGVELHVVAPDEWESHRALRLEMLLDAPDAFWTTHAEAAAMDEAQWRERIFATHHVMATLDGEPVGSVGMWPGREPDPQDTNLIAMYVAPRARGLGVGERLVEAVQDEAVRRGRRSVVLEVTSNNAPAMRLYQRMGFRRTGNRRAHPRRADLEDVEMAWSTAVGRRGAPSARILVVGPASWNLVVHLDRLPDPRPQTVFARRSSSTVGGTSAGKVLNLASLGADVTLATAIGSDREGELIEAAITAAGVPTVVVRTPGPSEQHVNLMDPEGGRVSVYLSLPDRGPLGSSPPPALVEALDRADVVVLDLSELSRPLLALARERGIPIWCDVHDYDGRSDYHLDFVAAATVLFLNDDGLVLGDAGGGGASAFMEACRAAGTELVVLTQGAEGATALTADGILHRVDAVPVDPLVDTNGAGDAFFSGFLVAHLSGARVDAGLRAGRSRRHAASRPLIWRRSRIPERRRPCKGIPMSDVAVRPLGEDDWQEFRGIRLEALAESPDAFASGYAEEEAYDEDFWRLRLRRSARLVAEAPDGRLLGLVNVGQARGEDGPVPEVAEIFGLWVRPEARGTGVATMLVEAGAKRAGSDGRSHIAYWVGTDNGRAVAFASGMGFRPTDYRRAMRSPSGVESGEQEIAMILPLGEDRGASFRL